MQQRTIRNLLSLSPTSAEYNYQYGICILTPEKKNARRREYLEVASKNPKIRNDVFFFSRPRLHVRR
jgi:hypothetical protein